MYWSLVQEGKNNLSIRRYYEGKNVRLSRKKYKHLLGNNEELTKLINRLNEPIRVEQNKKEVEINRSFDESNKLEGFLEEVRLKQRTERAGDYQIALLKKYYFTYFKQHNVRTCEQFEDIETKFYLHLIETLKLKYKTIKYIVQTINRFHLHLEKKSKRVNKLNYTRYHQFSLKHKFPFKKYDALNINHQKKKRIYVSEDTFQKLLAIADKRIQSHLNLAYKLGLRRGETYALSEENVYEDFVEISEALDSDGKITVPKSARIREISYHYISPIEVIELIKNRYSVSIDSISKLTKEAVDLLIEKQVITEAFDFHALRGSFCTNYLRDCQKLNKSHEDVRQEMGHSDIRTTMLYSYSTRKKEKKKFKYEHRDCK